MSLKVEAAGEHGDLVKIYDEFSKHFLSTEDAEAFIVNIEAAITLAKKAAFKSIGVTFCSVCGRVRPCPKHSKKLKNAKKK